MSNYLTYNTGIELACLFIALLCLANDKSLAWRIHIPFLMIICITEFIGIYIKEKVGQPNTGLYNILFLFEIAFYSFMFQHLLTRYFNSRPLIYTGLAILMLSYIVELFINGFFQRTHISLLIQGVLFVLYSLIYCYYLIKDDHYVALKYLSGFWWVAAVLICYFALTGLNVFYKELINILDKPRETFRFIRTAANISLYGLWAYAFICRKWLTAKS